MKIKKLIYEGPFGESIEDAMIKAIHMAKNENATVQASFNGIEMIVDGKSDVKETVALYLQRAKKSPAPEKKKPIFEL